MWTQAHRARHDARLKEIVSLDAVAQVAQWLERVDPPRSGRATPYGAVVRWGGRACHCLAPACGRKLARSAGHAPGVEDSLRLVSQVDEPGPVRPLAGGCGPPTPPRDGPPGQASPEHHRHAVSQMHSGARPTGL